MLDAGIRVQHLHSAMLFESRFATLMTMQAYALEDTKQAHVIQNTRINRIWHYDVCAEAALNTKARCTRIYMATAVIAVALLP